METHVPAGDQLQALVPVEGGIVLVDVNGLEDLPCVDLGLLG